MINVTAITPRDLDADYDDRTRLMEDTIKATDGRNRC